MKVAWWGMHHTPDDNNRTKGFIIIHWNQFLCIFDVNLICKSVFFEVQYLIIYCFDKTIFTNICIFETAKSILLNAQKLVPNRVCCIHWLCEIQFNLISYLDSRILFWVLFAESSQPPSMSTRDGDCSGSQNISATPWRKTLAWSRVVATYQNTEITTIFLVYHCSCFLLHIFPCPFLSFSSSILQREREREGEIGGGGKQEINELLYLYLFSVKTYVSQF